MYHFIDRLYTLYGLLRDEQSKDIFLARIAVDVDQSISNIKRLASLGHMKELSFLAWPQSQKDALKKLSWEHKKIILYGADYTGQSIARMLQSEGIDFYGFCDRNTKKFSGGVLGKPVISPEELTAHGNEYYVLPAVGGKQPYFEIFKFLTGHHYPTEHMLGWVDYQSIGEQYFEFLPLYHRGTAFIDGGCYDCEDSIRFAEWCEGEYSAIIAFEPDPGNYANCCKKVREAQLPNFQLINAGISSQEGTAEFNSENAGTSHVTHNKGNFDIVHDRDNFDKGKTNTNKISIRTVAIDDIIGERTVGFIKMDIEGGEFDALHGAENTILRDKPLLAICVYHLRGDVCAIMDYLHQVVPEYRFLLRHYGVSHTETVLYASVDL